ncbi:PD-(D/E)XK nuclease family protein [Candidatus Peregrinibacteria bacterium]|nr:PD-(D/E)XK nuclease family protein [Candidatus Peregrinibacteria bacterium]
MSDYYKIPRQEAWNYGGKNWRLSRSKIDLFMECPRCFWLDNKLGIKRPPGFPFTLNSAVDALLKKEFDKYRAEGKPHPIMVANGVDAVPFAHEKMDEWRDSLHAGVQFLHEPTGFLVSGGVDDVWVMPDGTLIVVDYKATSKAEEIMALDKDWQEGYKRQSEVYEWLLRKNGFKVSDTAYFVYANGDTEKDVFDNKLEFVTKLIPYTGSDKWVEPTLLEIKECLESEKMPEAGEECDYCAYREAIASA